MPAAWRGGHRQVDASRSVCRTAPYRVSSFLNIRVADIQAVLRQWSAVVQFLTPPRQHETEMRATSAILTAISSR